MQDKFLKEVVSIVVDKQSDRIADLINSRKHVNEFIIAKKMGLTINQTRNILYKLSDYGLVSSMRKKDKKKGWYTYFWKIEIFKSFLFLEDVVKKRMELIKDQIKERRAKVYYFCDICNTEFSEEEAMVKNFTCDECGKVFTLRDNTPIIKDLQKNLSRLDNELKIIREEIEIEKVKLDKQKIKEIAKQTKKTKKKNKEARIARQKKAKKVVKKKIKKAIKKKNHKKIKTKKTVKKKKKKR
ncbi:MAG: hypothetical protein AABX30_00795 [Nanoarchaeota archaeon]